MDYIKEAEGYLRSYNDLNQSIELMENEIQYLDEELTGAKAIDYSGVSSSGDSLPDDRIVNLLYQKQIKQKSLDLTLLKVKHIERIFSNLGERDEEILKAFYIKRLRGIELEGQFQLSERQLYNLRKIAIRRFAIQLFGIKVVGE